MKKTIKGQKYFTNTDARQFSELARRFGVLRTIDRTHFLADETAKELLELAKLAKNYLQFVKSAPLQPGQLVRVKSTKKIATVIRCVYDSTCNEAQLVNSPQWTQAIVTIVDETTGQSQQFYSAIDNLRKIKTK